MAITIKLANGTQHSVDVTDFGVTLADLKKQLAGTLDFPADEQRIIFRGKVLKDDCVLSAAGMEDGSVIHVVRSKKTAAAAPAATQTSAPTTSTAASVVELPVAPVVPSQPSQPQAAANPYAALMSNFGASQTQQATPGLDAFAGGANPFANMGTGMGMGMGGAGNPSPQQVNEMMQNPMMQQMVQQALNDPQLSQYIIQSSPHLASMPPEQQQAVLQMMRNPYMMQQMMSMMGGAGGAAGASMPNFAPSTGQTNTPALPPMGGFNPAMFAPPPPQGNPREIYREQLQQLRDMGFPNEEANIAALQQAQGNVQFALERLLGA